MNFACITYTSERCSTYGVGVFFTLVASLLAFEEGYAFRQFLSVEETGSLSLSLSLSHCH